MIGGWPQSNLSNEVPSSPNATTSPSFDSRGIDDDTDFLFISSNAIKLLGVLDPLVEDLLDLGLGRLEALGIAFLSWSHVLAVRGAYKMITKLAGVSG